MSNAAADPSMTAVLASQPLRSVAITECTPTQTPFTRCLTLKTLPSFQRPSFLQSRGILLGIRFSERQIFWVTRNRQARLPGSCKQPSSPLAIYENFRCDVSRRVRRSFFLRWSKF